ncbi:hypothetical protein LO763_25960 [Glycomyces sp. A-F 0318]|uniref:hypothetical protein n=1 Tax=Glycomyces amatae TaxID=2881355 RepID=UPI001E5C97CB|nr:hypothetical protein [Glycomyces amatae]MCD0447068.1 hypothetical protein [Glycomyces amatae]
MTEEDPFVAARSDPDPPSTRTSQIDPAPKGLFVAAGLDLDLSAPVGRALT